MNFTPLEIVASTAALVAAAAAIWQGILTRRAIESSFDIATLDQRLRFSSEAYSALERFSRLLRKNTVEDISNEDLKQLFVELDTAKASTNDLAFRCMATSFGSTYSKFSDFYVWFLKENDPEESTHSFFEEASLRADAMKVQLFAFAQSIQRPEDRV